MALQVVAWLGLVRSLSPQPSLNPPQPYPTQLPQAETFLTRSVKRTWRHSRGSWCSTWGALPSASRCSCWLTTTRWAVAWSGCGVWVGVVRSSEGLVRSGLAGWLQKRSQARFHQSIGAATTRRPVNQPSKRTQTNASARPAPTTPPPTPSRGWRWSGASG